MTRREPMQIRVRKKMMSPHKQKAASDVANMLVDAEEQRGVAEALAAGLPTLVAKYGHHSAESRAAERLMNKLN